MHHLIMLNMHSVTHHQLASVHDVMKICVCVCSPSVCVSVYDSLFFWADGSGAVISHLASTCASSDHLRSDHFPTLHANKHIHHLDMWVNVFFTHRQRYLHF